MTDNYIIQRLTHEPGRSSLKPVPIRIAGETFAAYHVYWVGRALTICAAPKRNSLPGLPILIRAAITGGPFFFG